MTRDTTQKSQNHQNPPIVSELYTKWRSTVETWKCGRETLLTQILKLEGNYYDAMENNSGKLQIRQIPMTYQNWMINSIRQHYSFIQVYNLHQVVKHVLLEMAHLNRMLRARVEPSSVPQTRLINIVDQTTLLDLHVFSLFVDIAKGKAVCFELSLRSYLSKKVM